MTSPDPGKPETSFAHRKLHQPPIRHVAGRLKQSSVFKTTLRGGKHSNEGICYTVRSFAEHGNYRHGDYDCELGEGNQIHALPPHSIGDGVKERETRGPGRQGLGEGGAVGSY